MIIKKHILTEAEHGGEAKISDKTNGFNEFLSDCWSMNEALQRRITECDDEKLRSIQQSLLDALLICIGRAESALEHPDATKAKAMAPSAPNDNEASLPIEPSPQNSQQPQIDEKPYAAPAEAQPIVADDEIVDAFACDFDEPSNFGLTLTDKDIEQLQGIPSED